MSLWWQHAAVIAIVAGAALYILRRMGVIPALSSRPDVPTSALLRKKPKRASSDKSST